MLLLQYNSTLGNFTGYTEKTKEFADDFNKNHVFVKKQKNVEGRCKAFIPWVFDTLTNPGDSADTLHNAV